MPGEEGLAALVFHEDFHYEPQVLAQALEHVVDCLPHEPPVPLLFLYQLEVRAARCRVRRMRLSDAQCPADPADIPVDHLAAVVYNVDVDRVPHLGVGACGVYLEHSLVEVSLGVCEFLSEVLGAIVFPVLRPLGVASPACVALRAVVLA